MTKLCLVYTRVCDESRAFFEFDNNMIVDSILER